MCDCAVKFTYCQKGLSAVCELPNHYYQHKQLNTQVFVTSATYAFVYFCNSEEYLEYILQAKKEFGNEIMKNYSILSYCQVL